MQKYIQGIMGSTLRSMPRDGTNEGRAQESNRVDDIRIRCAYHPDPSLVTHPNVLVLLNSISQINLALTNNIVGLHHDIFLPAKMD
jgi:hypothetical protein